MMTEGSRAIAHVVPDERQGEGDVRDRLRLPSLKGMLSLGRPRFVRCALVGHRDEEYGVCADSTLLNQFLSC